VIEERFVFGQGGERGRRERVVAIEGRRERGGREPTWAIDVGRNKVACVGGRRTQAEDWNAHGENDSRKVNGHSRKRGCSATILSDIVAIFGLVKWLAAIAYGKIHARMNCLAP
jgi:hypothetical protein